ncbi:MarR family winged helix-turn-helix transcriptional regulator [Roseibium suaedae]|uniref:DNA-binding transcriptional regulator, MarR family n=1 Tax=Roseibium suaedae TaxID=735517 RepID=A0A1M7H9Z9_9HYPH|nr:MarR family transcriptional regulator [Roseibium suaedae]SHM25256.1 DNA-binding transcriptional regulator, MarR family [Roseibium suaedae]
MLEDVVRALGHATLGSRLRRLGERLQADAQDLTGILTGKDLPSPHHTVLAALNRNGPLNIGDLAASLGQSQPGVTRMIGKMKAAGLVTAETAPTDKRVSTIHLTKEGTARITELEALHWPAVEAAVADLCGQIDGSLLDQLSALETLLTEKSLKQRVLEAQEPETKP